MNHLGTQELTSNRLILRRFTIDDTRAMYDNWASDPEVTTYLSWPTHQSEEITATVLEDWVKSYEKSDYYQWAITLKEHGPEPIGSIGVVRQSKSTSMLHIGYCLGKPWWRQGITSEALKTVIDFLFTEVEANRIEARFDPRNANSGKVMQACGMTCEGTMRQADRNNQGICDAACYAILRADIQ